MQTVKKLPKVVIIGAGPSGILCCRHLLGKAEVICFDGQHSFGGQWLPSKNKENQKAYEKYYGTHFSSLYSGLQANIPHQFMTWKDFPHKKEYQSGFLSAQEFLEYEQDYVKHWDLEKYMKFNTFVKDVSLVKNLEGLQTSDGEKFKVTVCKTDNVDEVSDFLAHYVIVCNGHNIQPHFPKFSNQDSFNGNVFHSHDLLDNSNDQEFEGKTVVIQGIRASAQDIAYKLKNLINPPKKIYWIGGSKKAEELYMQSTDFGDFFETERLKMVAERIVQSEPNTNTLVLTEGTKLHEVDAIIQCTGYYYTFPFLNSRDKIIEYERSVEDSEQVNYKLFGPLYKRMFAINEPNLIFVGLMERVRGLQLMIERLSIVASNYINNEFELPKQEMMLQEWNQDLEELKSRNPSMRALLQIDMQKFPESQYVGDLAKMVGMEFDEKFDEQLRDINKVMTGYQQKCCQPSLRKISFSHNHVSSSNVL